MMGWVVVHDRNSYSRRACVYSVSACVCLPFFFPHDALVARYMLKLRLYY